MKKNMKKIFALMLSATMALGALAGCGNEKQTTEESTPSTATSESKQETVASSEEEKPQETVNIVWYRYAGQTNADEDLVEAAINEYIEPLIGVTVSIINSTESATKLDVRLAAGEEIDLMHLSGQTNVYGKITSGVALDLNDYDIKTNYPGLYNAMPEIAWESASYNGHTYWIPCYKEMGVGFSLMVETALVDKYGWDMSTVKELKDIEPMLAQLKADGYDRAFRVGDMMYEKNSATNTFKMLTAYAGIREDGSSNEVVFIPESEEYKEYVTMMYNWNKAGYINQDEADSANKNAMTKKRWESGEHAFWLRPTTPDMKAAQDARMGFDTTVMQVTPCYIGSDSTVGSAWVINSQTEKAEACLKFVELLNTDQTLADMAIYGIEDKHYTRSEAGKITVIADSGYKYPGRWCVTGIRVPSLLETEADDLVAQYEEFNETSQVSVTNGFVFDDSAVSAEVASISNVIAEYQLLIEKGFYDPEEYLPKYSAALKSAGAETIIAEMQKQYDAWLASK